MSEQPVNPKRGTAAEELNPPAESTVKRLQQLIGVAWTDWDEPEMKAPTLAFLDSIEALNSDEQRSKAEARQLITQFWGNGDQLDEFSNLLASWAEGDFHVSAFDPLSAVETAPAVADDAIADLPMANGQQVAICIGHTASGNGSGAQNKYAVIKDEHKWNEEVAFLLRDILISRGASPKIYYRTDGGYSSFVAKQSREIRTQQPNCKCAIELHYNASANPTSHGCEFLCYSNSGERLARELVNAYKGQFPEMRLRRDNGVYRISSGNGVGWLKSVPPPAVIVEPFFSSNEQEMLFFDGKKQELAMAYAKGMLNFVNS
ncbi:N-acetylmuramoyl-L-alanine amidase [Glaciecola sp. SC05]|uniref:N-acetylmuramoyl-L-alanine amidase n=1 Tax=Glaciecola sp. SC05 TaxID=1987355 RepID=UPI003528DAC8